MKKINLVVSIFLLVFTSCKADKNIELECFQAVSYSENVQSIIMNSCAVSGCHNAETAANNMVFEDYQSVFDNREMILKAINGESGVTPMPIGDDLTSEEINIVSCWIAQGAPNN